MLMRFERKTYFDKVREPLFFGSMSQDQVDGQEYILSMWEKYTRDHDLRWLAYFLATAIHETASTMQPIAEYGKGSGQPYGEVDPVTEHAYYGRGYVQLTWADNYKKADEEFDWKDQESCYLHPDLQLQGPIAARTGYRGMMDGWFRAGKEFSVYFNASRDDPYHARDIINGDMDMKPEWGHGQTYGAIIAGYHEKFLAALEASATTLPETRPGSENAITSTQEEATNGDAKGT
jgi:putative chitinase